MAKSLVDMNGLSPDDLKQLLLRALEEISSLKLENTALREEIARLKGLKGKPNIKANVKPSGMEKGAKPRSGKKRGTKNPGKRQKNPL